MPGPHQRTGLTCLCTHRAQDGAKERDPQGGKSGGEGATTQKGGCSGRAEQAPTAQSEGSGGRAGVPLNLKQDPKLGVGAGLLIRDSHLCKT